MKPVAIGDQFIKRGKRIKHVNTVVDMHTTYNLAGDVVSVRYVATHEFCGQQVTERDIGATTILMGRLDSEVA